MQYLRYDKRIRICQLIQNKIWIIRFVTVKEFTLVYLSLELQNYCWQYCVYHNDCCFLTFSLSLSLSLQQLLMLIQPFKCCQQTGFLCERKALRLCVYVEWKQKKLYVLAFQLAVQIELRTTTAKRSSHAVCCCLWLM